MKGSISRPLLVAALLLACAARAEAQSARPGVATTFTVRIENVARRMLTLPNGNEADIPVSAGAWAVHTGGGPFFTAGQPAPPALKALAEAGLPGGYAGTLPASAGVRASGVYDAPQGRPRGRMQTSRMEGGGANATRMLHAGQHFEFTISAQPGDRLSLAFMVSQSNDGFLATHGVGIPLFDEGGRPVSGDVTGRLTLWDAGTEVNEPPGAGRNQGLRQGAAHAGDPERRPVRPMAEAEFGDAWPPVERMVRVTITPGK
jgi:hypothetical protein